MIGAAPSRVWKEIRKRHDAPISGATMNHDTEVETMADEIPPAQERSSEPQADDNNAMAHSPEKIAELLDAIEKHDLLIGTAYSFQGEERDVMLLTFTLDADSHPTSF